MTDFVLAGADPHTMLSHLALCGLAAIVEQEGLQDVRLSWTPGMGARPVLSAEDATAETIGAAVQRHAARLDNPGSWPHRQLSDTEKRALMSPRISVVPDVDGWRSLQGRRHDVLDQLTGARAMLDLRLIAALGEPSYWSRNNKGDRLQDDGASRMEMQPRNQGSEFVGNRLRPLAAAVAARTPAQINAGLQGHTIRDEIGRDDAQSRTPTGLADPGPTDNALAWCALWGLSQFPIAFRRNDVALTSAHIGRGTAGYYALPVWSGPWRTARYRSIAASGHLARFAQNGLTPRDLGRKEADPDGVITADPAAREWLADRGITGVVRFQVRRFGSASAPERRAARGTILKTGRP
jgi:CRISPR-associated protein Csb3